MHQIVGTVFVLLLFIPMGALLIAASWTEVAAGGAVQTPVALRGVGRVLEGIGLILPLWTDRWWVGLAVLGLALELVGIAWARRAPPEDPAF
ncbi:MAG TPA: hypothetical protein VH210_06355 [Gaiellaceae bacterium]|jgi:hypothetical protein|nr:hypothetical protein [Gaiellaceae bacterium]